MSRTNHARYVGDGPTKRFKRHHNRMEKTIYKKQFKRWLQDNDYPIVDQQQRHSALWAWY